MSNENKDSDLNAPLREHSYDGISEYDNQLPRWWVNKFLLTIVFAAGYFYWYHIDDGGRGLIESFDRSQKTEAIQKALQTPSTPELSEDQLMAMVSQESVLKSGAEIFKSRCVSCHGSEGEGIVGPNLTDDYWIHGGRMTEIVATITNGVPAKGMVPWKSMLSADEIHQVAAFVKSLRGQKVKNPKAPEGTLVTP